MDVALLPGETLDDLQNGYRIIQHPDVFAFGTDAVLLAHFAQTAGASAPPTWARAAAYCRC
jgi:hypothetical protein